MCRPLACFCICAKVRSDRGSIDFEIDPSIAFGRAPLCWQVGLHAASNLSRFLIACNGLAVGLPCVGYSPRGAPSRRRDRVNEQPSTP